MAKKKVSHSSNSQDPKHSQIEAQTIPMATLTDDSSLQQIQSLRNLNGKLLKETTERRQQIDSLQSEIRRSAVSYNDILAAFHIENVVASVFVDSQVKEMNLCFDMLLGEKDREVEGLNRQLESLAVRFRNETGVLVKERDRLVYQTKVLGENVEREVKLRGEAEKSRVEGEKLLSQKQRDVAELKTERDSALKSSRESLLAVETLKEEIEAVRREKDEFLKVSENQKQKIGGLEEELTRVNECLKMQEESTRVRLDGVGNKLGLATQRVEEMKKENISLHQEKKEIEKVVEMLTEENAGVRKSLNVAMKELEDKQHKVDETVRVKGEIEEAKVNLESEIVGLREKINELQESYMKELEDKQHEIDAAFRVKGEIEQVKVNLESEIVELRQKINELRKSYNEELEDKQHEVDAAVRVKGEIEEVKVNLESEIVQLREKISDLKKSYTKFETENKQLLSEVESYRNAVEKERVEKGNMKKGFDEERKRVEKLELLISKLKETVVKREADLGQLRNDRDKLVENEKKLEGNVSVLRKENDALQSKLLEARKEVEELSGKVDVWCKNWNKALALLKHTATLVSQQKGIEEEVVANGKNVEEMEEIAVEEVEKIKKAFESKEEMLDEMKQKVVSLNKSVVEAHKSKNMWTVLSSATTIFAAALVAYVARGR